MTMGRVFAVAVFGAALQPACAGWRTRSFPQAEVATPIAVVPSVLPTVALDEIFEKGLREGKAAVAFELESEVGGWTSDGGVGVPSHMVVAETTLRNAMEASPVGHLHVRKMAALATRLYEHAKWLALRDQATAAEQRFRGSADLALRAGNAALATQSLSRLGFFLKQWGRVKEAKEVLQQAIVVSEEVPASEASHIASFLFGVLQRRDAVASCDASTLAAADSRVLAADKLPSKALEAERRHLVGSINYWRTAESSVTMCFNTSDVAHFAICVYSHLVRAVHSAFV